MIYWKERSSYYEEDNICVAAQRPLIDELRGEANKAIRQCPKMSVQRISACGIPIVAIGKGLQALKKRRGYHSGKNTTIRENKQAPLIHTPLKL